MHSPSNGDMLLAFAAICLFFSTDVRGFILLSSIVVLSAAAGKCYLCYASVACSWRSMQWRSSSSSSSSSSSYHHHHHHHRHHHHHHHNIRHPVLRLNVASSSSSSSPVSLHPGPPPFSSSPPPPPPPRIMTITITITIIITISIQVLGLHRLFQDPRRWCIHRAQHVALLSRVRQERGRGQVGR